MSAAEGKSTLETANVFVCYSPTVHAILRKRARLAQQMGWGVILAITVLLTGGIVLIINPPRVFPKTYESDYWTATPIYTYTPDYEYYDDGKSAPLSLTQVEKDLAGKVAELKKRLDAKERLDAEQDDQLKALESKNEGIEHRLVEMKKTVEEEHKKERNQWEALFGVFATRFGIAALVVLLMRFMCSIYRYHARMAAFYDAKADVFEACKEGDVQTMERLSHILTPTAVDFYETSDTIVEHAVELAKRAASSHS